MHTSISETRGIDVQLLLILFIGGFVGSLCAFLSLHGKKQKDVGYDESHEEFSFLLDRARNEVLIATDLDTNTFANDEVLDHLVEARNRGCDIRLLYDKRAKLEDVPKLAELHEKGVVATKKYPKALDVHFVVIDGQHVRLDRHPFRKYEEDGAEGRVILKTLELGRKYRHHFDVMWER